MVVVWLVVVVFVGFIFEVLVIMQGIFGGVYWGFGNGGGGVIGGLLIIYVGVMNFFFIFGIISFVDLSLFIFLNNIEFFSCFEWFKGMDIWIQYILQKDKIVENEELEMDYDEFY